MATNFRKKWTPAVTSLRRRYDRFRVLSKHPFAVPIITVLALLLVTAGVYILASDTNSLPAAKNSEIVIISHDNEQQIVPSTEPTVGALLHKLNITLNRGDVVEPAQTAKIDQDQFRINIYRAVPVQIIDGSSVSYDFSAATTPRSIVEQSGTTLYAEDDVSINPAENFLRTGSVGEQVVINRAVPVNLNLYGTPLTLRTHASTVGELIKQDNIKLASSDQIMPTASTALTANAEIFIVRNGTKIESVTQAIPEPVQTIDDPTLSFGTSAVRQQGSGGQQVITYQDQLKNGVVIGRTVIQTLVTQQPVTEIAVVGTSLSGIKGDMALAGIAPSDYEYADYIMSHESGWCPTKAEGEHDCPAVPDGSTSGAYGLCQALPGYKMASAGADWETNPITQLRWCSGYAASRYGSWYNAYIHWMVYSNW